MAIVGCAASSRPRYATAWLAFPEVDSPCLSPLRFIASTDAAAINITGHGTWLYCPIGDTKSTGPQIIWQADLDLDPRAYSYVPSDEFAFVWIFPTLREPHHTSRGSAPR
jgi:hypothetical protein